MTARSPRAQPRELSPLGVELLALAKGLRRTGRDRAASRDRLRAATTEAAAQLERLAGRVEIEIDAGVGRAVLGAFQSLAATVAGGTSAAGPPGPGGGPQNGRIASRAAPPRKGGEGAEPGPVDRFIAAEIRDSGDDRVSARHMAAAYAAWRAVDGTAPAMSDKALGRALRARGLLSARSSVIWWVGVRLVTPPSASRPGSPPAPSPRGMGGFASQMGDMAGGLFP